MKGEGGMEIGWVGIEGEVRVEEVLGEGSGPDGCSMIGSDFRTYAVPVWDLPENAVALCNGRFVDSSANFRLNFWILLSFFFRLDYRGDVDPCSSGMPRSGARKKRKIPLYIYTRAESIWEWNLGIAGDVIRGRWGRDRPPSLPRPDISGRRGRAESECLQYVCVCLPRVSCLVSFLSWSSAVRLYLLSSHTGRPSSPRFVSVPGSVRRDETT